MKARHLEEALVVASEPVGDDAVRPEWWRDEGVRDARFVIARRRGALQVGESEGRWHQSFSDMKFFLENDDAVFENDYYFYLYLW